MSSGGFVLGQPNAMLIAVGDQSHRLPSAVFGLFEQPF